MYLYPEINLISIRLIIHFLYNWVLIASLCFIIFHNLYGLEIFYFQIMSHNCYFQLSLFLILINDFIIVSLNQWLNSFINYFNSFYIQMTFFLIKYYDLFIELHLFFHVISLSLPSLNFNAMKIITTKNFAHRM